MSSELQWFYINSVWRIRQIKVSCFFMLHDEHNRHLLLRHRAGASLSCGRIDAGGRCLPVQRRICPTSTDVCGFWNKSVLSNVSTMRGLTRLLKQSNYVFLVWESKFYFFPSQVQCKILYWLKIPIIVLMHLYILIMCWKCIIKSLWFRTYFKEKNKQTSNSNKTLEK